MKTILIGAVNSAERTLHKLIEHQFDVIKVYGYESENTDLISGYASLKHLAEQSNLDYFPFKSINEHVKEIEQLNADIVFVVGLSQLVSERIVKSPSLCCVGFHPTKLPIGRGRAPLAWLVLDRQPGAATFFQISEGVDDGPIFVQTPFNVTDDDDALSVSGKILHALDESLDRWLPDLKANGPFGIPQQEELATYYARRTPEDGIINWHLSADEIDRHVKSASNPHPGAYSYLGINKITVWKSQVVRDIDIKGVVGRVVQTYDNGSFIVQTGIGLLSITKFDSESQTIPRVGDMLGYYSDVEIYKLKLDVEELKRQLLELKTTKGCNLH